MSSLVIVESPAKAKTIEKYLGKDYKVMASYGHVRDLPPKDGSVSPDNDFSMIWETTDKAKKNLSDIERALKTHDTLVLATDPDREGEAISWHVAEHLTDRKLLKGKNVQRVTFNEITKNAIKDAFSRPRDINQELVDAYLARRALDYLVGFNISPVLWRKLPGSRSAGRVQSVALRLICEREDEIEKFVAQEYWTIEILFKTGNGQEFTARLTEYQGKKLDKFALKTQDEAEKVVADLSKMDFAVASIERKQVKRNPPPPFITSSLQMEASRKFGFGAQRTMRIAQRLYEGVDIGGEHVGLITYMRTDGVTLSQDAILSCRTVIDQRYGQDYLPEAPRQYTSKAKNAQEAHEAIRPTDLSRTPDSVARYLEPDEAKLYEIIWKRTLACQMANAVLDQVAVDIASNDNKAVLRANGSVITFDGFMKVYFEDKDDPDEEDEDNRRLPALKEKEKLARDTVTPYQHFTQPPPRYSEASLVKKLEELGIGRPSTYASIIHVLQERNYVTLEKKRFMPQDRGRVVTSFLVHFFPRYVQYDFTAGLEDELDDISGGRINWKQVLRQFWKDFSKTLDDVKPLTITNVIDAMNEDLAAFLFPPRGDGKDPRICPACANGQLSLKLGKFGAFVGCSNYPECKFTRKLAVESHEGEEGADAAAINNEPKILGTDPDTGLTVSLRHGPYGPYVQLDPEGTPKKGEKPKRASLPKGAVEADIDLAKALSLLALPRKVGILPETGETIEAGIGRFGPFVKAGSTYASIPKGEDVLSIGLNRAVDLIITKRENPPKNNFRRGGFKKAEAATDGETTAKPKTSARKTASASKSAGTKAKPAAKKTLARKRS